MYVKDKKLVSRRFGSSFNTYNEKATMQLELTEKLVDNLKNYGFVGFERVLEIGCGTGFLTSKILEDLHVGHLFLNDIETSAFQSVIDNVGHYKLLKTRFIPGDAENMIFPENLDAVLSTSTFQWFNDIETFISNIRNVLMQNGVLAFTTFGQCNFIEIRKLLGVGLEYKTMQQLKRTLETGFKIIHAEEYKCKMGFENPVEVLKHMKNTGVNGVQKTFFGRDKLNSFIESYNCLFSNRKGEVGLTYHPIIIIAQKK